MLATLWEEFHKTYPNLTQPDVHFFCGVFSKAVCRPGGIYDAPAVNSMQLTLAYVYV